MSDDGRYVVFASSATTLGATDTNTVDDVFLHDRMTQATTRVGESSTGAQASGPSRGPVISDNGAVIAFISEARNLTDAADPFPCEPAQPRNCGRAFLRPRATGETTRIDLTDWSQSGAGTAVFRGLGAVELAATGSKVAMASNGSLFLPPISFFLFDRQTQRSTRFTSGLGAPGPIALSGNGRIMAHRILEEWFVGPARVFDTFDGYRG